MRIFTLAYVLFIALIVSAIPSLAQDSSDVSRAVPPGEPMGPSGHFTLSAGLALPVGEFADVSNGAARMGYTGTAEYELRFGRYVGWVTQFHFTYNSVDEDAMRSALGLNSSAVSLTTTPWIIYSPVTGLKLTGPVSPGFSLFCIAALGAAFGTSPGITLSGPGGSIKQNSGSASAFTYSFSAGFVAGNVFTLSARYMSAKPKYDITISGNAGGQTMSGSGQFEQNTAIVQIEAGIQL